MKTSSIPAERIIIDEAPTERGYAAWKQAKIERGKAQAMDRSAMIPADQVWRDLGLES